MRVASISRQLNVDCRLAAPTTKRDDYPDNYRNDEDEL
jgi:hypothetical protein